MPLLPSPVELDEAYRLTFDTATALTDEQRLRVINRAVDLMQQPHVQPVARYMDFATDAGNCDVEFGDPAACKFCMAGIVEHAAYLELAVDHDLADFPRGVIANALQQVQDEVYNDAISDFATLWETTVDPHARAIHRIRDKELREQVIEQMREGMITRLETRREAYAT